MSSICQKCADGAFFKICSECAASPTPCEDCTRSHPPCGHLGSTLRCLEVLVVDMDGYDQETETRFDMVK